MLLEDSDEVILFRLQEYVTGRITRIFPNEPFPPDWKPIFTGCSVSKDAPIVFICSWRNFFLWKCYLKVDTTDSWSGDSLEADWDSAEGSWAVFTAACPGPACDHNSPGWQHQWVMPDTVLAQLSIGNFYKVVFLWFTLSAITQLNQRTFRRKVSFRLSLYDFPCPCHSHQNPCRLCIQVWTNQTCYSLEIDPPSQHIFWRKPIKVTFFSVEFSVEWMSISYSPPGNKGTSGF